MSYIVPPLPVFTGLVGEPLENGMIYIGESPDAEDNPITVYWDAALTDPAEQPIRTRGGYPVYQGRAGQLYIAETEALITVKTASGLTILPNADAKPFATAVELASTAGAGMVGADDASAGAKYTTVQGFINYLLSSVGSAIVGFIQSGIGAVASTVQAVLRTYPVTPQQFGAVGDGVTDDTAAFVAMFATTHRNFYVPPGTYKVSSLSIPANCHFMGAGRASVIDVDNAGGVGITITAASFAAGGGPYEIGCFRITGEADTAVDVDTALRLNMHDIEMEGFTGLNGFIFERTFACTFQNLWTNGATLSNACFIVGSAFNANACINWYTSNRCLYSLYMDQNRGGATAPGHGSTWVTPCFQSTDYGIFARSYIGATFLGLYTEDVVHPVKLGNKAAGELSRAFVFQGGDIQGPYDTHPQYDDRRTVIDLDYALGIEIGGMDMSGAFNCGNACPLTITGDGTGAVAVARVWNDGGVWKVHSVEVLCEGTGYTAATVTAGGSGTGATFTATLSGTTVASIAVDTAGSGYEPAAIPTLIRYKHAYRCSIEAVYFNSGQGEQSPLYPWLVRAAGAEVRAGVTIDDDLSWRGTSARFGAAELRKVSTSSAYQHVLIDSNETAAERRTSYYPPEYV